MTEGTGLGAALAHPAEIFGAVSGAVSSSETPRPHSQWVRGNLDTTSMLWGDWEGFKIGTTSPGTPHFIWALHSPKIQS